MPSLSFLTNPTSRQISRITSLYRQAGWWNKEKKDNPELVKKIISGSHCFAVATSDDTIIAIGRAISDRAGDAYIQDVTVQEKSRGNGIGADIIRMIISCLHKDGIYWIALVAEQNSHPFYEGLGFSVMRDSMPMIYTQQK